MSEWNEKRLDERLRIAAMGNYFGDEMIQAADRIRRLEAALQEIKAYPVGDFRPLADECSIWRIADEALNAKAEA